MQRQPDGSLLWGVIVETEAYSLDDSPVMIFDGGLPKTKPFLSTWAVLCVRQLWHPSLRECGMTPTKSSKCSWFGLKCF